MLTRQHITGFVAGMLAVYAYHKVRGIPKGGPKSS